MKHITSQFILTVINNLNYLRCRRINAKQSVAKRNDRKSPQHRTQRRFLIYLKLCPSALPAGPVGRDIPAIPAKENIADVNPCRNIT